MPPRGRPTLVVLPPVASSSVASLSSASSCDAAAACRSLALAASPAFRRNSALLAAYFGPSSLSSSPRARTTLLTPTAIICRQVISLLRSTLSSNTCASTDDAGAWVPFGCIVTADDEITTVRDAPYRILLRSRGGAGRGLSPGVEVSRPGVEGVELLSSCCRGIEVSRPVEACRGLSRPVEAC